MDQHNRELQDMVSGIAAKLREQDAALFGPRVASLGAAPTPKPSPAPRQEPEAHTSLQDALAPAFASVRIALTPPVPEPPPTPLDLLESRFKAMEPHIEPEMAIAIRQSLDDAAAFPDDPELLGLVSDMFEVATDNGDEDQEEKHP
jgi:hypothetical protein